MEIDLDGVRTWYDVTGSGEPLVHLHGGYNDSRAIGDELPAYEERYQVFRCDRRGHGRTPDVGPLTYELMAGVLEFVGSGPVETILPIRRA